MIEEKNEIVIDPEELKGMRRKENKAMRKAFSRCGFAVLLMTCAVLLLGIVLGVGMFFIDQKTTELIYKNYLYLNEALVAVALCIGILPLLGLPTAKPQKQPIKIKHLIAFLCVGMLFATVGNYVGNFFVIIWNHLTKSEVANPLIDILSNVSPLQTFICTVILAPILEELFFRKLLIDRMRAHGEFAAVMISAVFFALFHGNFSQLFYAFLLGALLGYLYCKTGSFLAVVLVHMVFNFIGGQIPMLFLSDITEFTDKLTLLLEQNNIDEILPLMVTFAVPILLYGLFMVFRSGLDVVGVVCFATNARKVRFVKAESLLTKKERAKASLLNVGMIAACVVLILQALSSLILQ